ncbi:MAG: sigma-54 dependent transcriptional regulator [Beijerinckiaceae bacterium]|jgi:two-component system, NtrC family, C4-dicarboxylate transport response regulator DctD|nr:sigma-54 dependent transcriptional regulator [Beijerinckiaceae bacterium]MDO9442340.1 sigma-54 dependent transcriptional regulator [Beijerinckiaceae bacterium]
MHPDLHVLLVEDDPAVRFANAQTLKLAGLNVESVASAEAALDRLHPFFPGVLLVDVRLPGMDGLTLLERAQRMEPALPVIVITGHGDVAMAVQAMRAGAYDFLEKPTPTDVLVDTALRALERRKLTFELADLRAKLQQKDGIERILIGKSAGMAALRRNIMQLAEAGPDVLILGETGSGKELVARCLHEASPARDKPFVAINCGAIPENMFETELFGHERGAFTGAQMQRIGKIEYASGGTLFLDEVESMPLAMQVKLLRVLQFRQVERLGSNKPVPVTLRVVAATKTDLARLSAEQSFRSDLYFRLNVVSLDIPPLRARREDIPVIFDHHVQQAAKRYAREAPAVSDALMRELMTYDWPGNVRELANAADRFVLGVLSGRFGEAVSEKRALNDLVAEFERGLIVEALRRHQGNVAAAADSLCLPKKTLYDKLKRFDLTGEDYR